MNIPWPVRSALAGTAGTVAMTLAYVLERQLRPNRRGPLDCHDPPRSRTASAIFAGTVMSSVLTLFPLLGRTPPPWRWPVDVIATSVGTHAAYVVGVAAAMNGTSDRLQR